MKKLTKLKIFNKNSQIWRINNYQIQIIITFNILIKINQATKIILINLNQIIKWDLFNCYLNLNLIPK